MKKHILKVYALEIFLMVILFFTLFVLNKASYIYISIIIALFAFVTKIFLNKKNIVSTNNKQVKWLMIAFALIYLGIFYLLGMIKYDFYESATLFSFKTLYRFIIPLTLIIVSTEFIRFRFLSQEAKILILKKKVDLSKIIIFICMVLIDLIIYVGIYDLTDYDDFLTVLGFIFFASVSCNLFYNYISLRYGIVSIILYRLITTLYVYIIPFIPDVYVYFRTFLRMVYPYILYIIFEKTFSRTDFVVSYVDRRKNVVGITILIVLLALTTMLISCQFRYGILVIGSGSMTGTINVGDAVFFESYNGQEIKNGQIIIFEKKGIKLVHRVIKIRNVNNEIRYYTKGDANKVMDSGYVVDDNIVGITKFRIMYIGHPTLWVRSLFS